MKQTLILTAALLVMLLCACSGGQKPADAELRIFSLVAEPASEGDNPTALRRADSLIAFSRVRLKPLQAKRLTMYIVRTGSLNIVL